MEVLSRIGECLPKQTGVIGMKILGMDSSGLVASVAVVENDILRGEYTTHYKKTHSQTLLPMLEELQRMIELELTEIDAIAIAAGPGSFTGLRIGAATAKGLGLALEKPLIEIPTLEGLAYNLCGAADFVCPILDARRSQVYTGVYEFRPNEKGTYDLGTVMEQCAVSVTELAKQLNEYGRRVIFLGDGVPVYRPVLEQQLTVPCSFAPANNSHQRAASVAALGAVYFARGRTVTAAKHQPEYLRKSQAERERDEKRRETEHENHT